MPIVIDRKFKWFFAVLLFATAFVYGRPSIADDMSKVRVKCDLDLDYVSFHACLEVKYPLKLSLNKIQSTPINTIYVDPWESSILFLFRPGASISSSAQEKLISREGGQFGKFGPSHKTEGGTFYFTQADLNKSANWKQLLWQSLLPEAQALCPAIERKALEGLKRILNEQVFDFALTNCNLELGDLMSEDVKKRISEFDWNLVSEIKQTVIELKKLVTEDIPKIINEYPEYKEVFARIPQLKNQMTCELTQMAWLGIATPDPAGKLNRLHNGTKVIVEYRKKLEVLRDKLPLIDLLVKLKNKKRHELSDAGFAFFRNNVKSGAALIKLEKFDESPRGNFMDHFEWHRGDFGSRSLSLEEYKGRIHALMQRRDAFVVNTKFIDAASKGPRLVTMDLKTGEALITTPEGRFISFHRRAKVGAQPEELLYNFLERYYPKEGPALWLENR